MVLVGQDFWGGLAGWIRATMIETGTISPEDAGLFYVTDTVQEALDYVVSGAKKMRADEAALAARAVNR